MEVPDQAADKVTEEEAAKIATEAYIYGYPLVTLEITRRVVTNTAVPATAKKGQSTIIDRRV